MTFAPNNDYLLYIGQINPKLLPTMGDRFHFGSLPPPNTHYTQEFSMFPKKVLLALMATSFIASLAFAPLALAGPDCDGKATSTKITDSDTPKQPVSEG